MPQRGAARGKSCFLILPILNRKVSLCGLSGIDLGSRAKIKPIDQAHIGPLLDAAPEQYKDSINTRSKCVYVTIEEDAGTDESLRRCDIISRYVFNFFASESPIFFSFGVVGTQTRKLSVKHLRVFAQGTERFYLSSVHYALRKTVSPAELRTYYELVTDLSSKHPRLCIIFERINLFLSREVLEDRIVDLTIALEALIPGTTELGYRFALWLSFIIEPDETKRLEVFNLMKDLYAFRSSVVHSGEVKPQLRSKIQDNISTIRIHALRAVNYYVFFLYAG